MAKYNSEYLAEFKSYLADIGKSEGVQSACIDMLQHPDVTALLPDDKQIKIKQCVEDFELNRQKE